MGKLLIRNYKLEIDMVNFQKVKLKDICERIDYGFTASASDFDVGPKFLRITDIAHSSINWDNVPYCKISETEKNKYLLTDGDIVIARTGATTGYAKCLKNPQEAVFASYLVRFRVNNTNNYRFVGHVIESLDYKEFIKNNLGGSAQPQANAQILGSYELYLPDKETQTRIASVLSAYDDLIENNEKRIKALEEMAQLLYTEWFVKFKFHGYEKIKMVDSGTEYGMVPEGWEVVPISKLAKFMNGYPFKPKDLGEYGLPIIKIPELRSGILEKTPRNSGEGINKKYIIQTGDILFSWSATLLVNIWNSGKALLNQHLFKVTPKEKHYKTYTFYTLGLLVEKIRKHVVGATMQHLRKDTVESSKILLPSIDILPSYEFIASKILEEISVLYRKNQNLSKIRDLLIPQLVTGRREVR